MTNEKRLIDANALMKYINETHSYAGLPMAAHICTMELLTYAHTVDAVEVVRCKDCKHYKPQNQGAHRNCTTPYCMRVVAVKVSPDDFCSYGERKDNG